MTKPLEDKLRELSEIKEIESTSRPGISLISLELEDWVDHGNNEDIFSKIRDMLADGEVALPATASKPAFDDKRGAVAYSLIVAIKVDADAAPQLAIMTRLAKELADRLRNVAGTEHVRLFGAPTEEITVTIDPGEPTALGLSTTDVATLIGAADAKAPAGVLRARDRDVLLEVEGEMNSIHRISEIPVTENATDGLVKLGDIARIGKSWRDPPPTIAYADGVRAILIAARTEPKVRLDQWAIAARDTIEAFTEQFDATVTVDVSFDQSRYTEARLHDLGGNLLAGALVVMLVVLLGMGWRAALVVGAALPLSAAFTLFGLTLFGQQIHQITIASQAACAPKKMFRGKPGSCCWTRLTGNAQWLIAEVLPSAKC